MEILERNQPSDDLMHGYWDNRDREIVDYSYKHKQRHAVVLGEHSWYEGPRHVWLHQIGVPEFWVDPLSTTLKTPNSQERPHVETMQGFQDLTWRSRASPTPKTKKIVLRCGENVLFVGGRRALRTFADS